jgi:hypothetical protein
MRRPLLLLSIVLLCAAISQAQPVINNMENYSIGMSFKTKHCATAGIAHGSGGANQVWQFTNLQVIDSLTSWIVSPSSTPYASTFPNASYTLRNTKGSYRFFQKTSAYNDLLGSVDSANGLTVTYPLPVAGAVRPLTTSSGYTDSFSVFYPGSGMKGFGGIVMTADGYGTLHLPGASYQNVIRVKTVIDETDTVFQGPPAITSRLIATIYTWYDDLHKTPLLTWDSTHIINSIGSFAIESISYLASESGTTTGVEGTAATQLDLTAYLSKNILRINGVTSPGRYAVSVFSTEGKRIYHNIHPCGNTSMALEMPVDFPPGLYLVSVADDKGAGGFIRVVCEQ